MLKTMFPLIANKLYRSMKLKHPWSYRLGVNTLNSIQSTEVDCLPNKWLHCNGITMNIITSQVTSDSTVYLTICLTYWGRVTHICVGKLTIIGSDNGLSPERRQAIIWTNAGILLIGPLGTNFSEILMEIQTFSLKKIRLQMSSAKCCSFCLGLNVLR